MLSLDHLPADDCKPVAAEVIHGAFDIAPSDQRRTVLCRVEIIQSVLPVVQPARVARLRVRVKIVHLPIDRLHAGDALVILIIVSVVVPVIPSRRNDGREIVLDAGIHIYSAADAGDGAVAGILPHRNRAGIVTHRIVLCDPFIPGHRTHAFHKPVSAGVNHGGVTGAVNHRAECIDNCRLIRGRHPDERLVFKIDRNRERDRIIRACIYYQIGIRHSLRRILCKGIAVYACPYPGCRRRRHIIAKIAVNPVQRVAAANHGKRDAGVLDLLPVNRALIGGDIDARLGRLGLDAGMRSKQRQEKGCRQSCQQGNQPAAASSGTTLPSGRTFRNAETPFLLHTLIFCVQCSLPTFHPHGRNISGRAVRTF